MPIRRWNAAQLVNSTTAGDQFNHSTVALADGGYIVTFQSGATGDTSVLAQRFDAFGNRYGGQYQLRLGDTGFEGNPAAAQLSNGSVVYAWTDQYGQSQTDFDISAVLIAPDGTRTPLSLPSNISTEQEVKVAANGTGFVIAYTDYATNAGDIILKFHDAAGNYIKSVQANINAAGPQTQPDIVQLDSGMLVVVWKSDDDDVRMRVFDDGGFPESSEEIVYGGPGTRTMPEVTALVGGGFVVSWETQISQNNWDIRARVYSDFGEVVSPEFSLSRATQYDQRSPSIAALADGGFLAVWDDFGLLRAQIFDGLGNRVGLEQVLASVNFGFASESGGLLTAEGLVDGRVVVTWTEYNGDGSGYGIRSLIVDPRDGIVNDVRGADILVGNDQLADDMAGFWGNDTIYGLRGDDFLFGDAGNDHLDGGLGDDFMVGGAGDDTFIVDGLGDTVVEAAEPGFDTVHSSVSYTLGANVERLFLIGTKSLTGIGNELGNVIVGTSASNRLEGGLGNDTLDGWLGADKMYGGLGDDTYYVDNANDKTNELAGEGTDIVYSRISFSLAGQYVENITLEGLDNIDATGNTLANVLTGNAGNNRLDGGSGADQMYGGLGDDTFIVSQTGDRVFEYNGQGTDTVLSSVSFSLAGQYIENLYLTGTGSISATGNSLENIIGGNVGANRLTGGAGKDTFVFDTALGGGNVDTITDYSAASDTIRLSKAIFAAFATTGTIAQSQFQDLALGAANAQDRILYNSATGDLFYDADGSGSTVAIRFAIIENLATLTYEDFLIA